MLVQMIIKVQRHLHSVIKSTITLGEWPSRFLVSSWPMRTVELWIISLWSSFVSTWIRCCKPDFCQCCTWFPSLTVTAVVTVTGSLFLVLFSGEVLCLFSNPEAFYPPMSEEECFLNYYKINCNFEADLLLLFEECVFLCSSRGISLLLGS